MEALLLEKTRKLEHQLTTARLQLAEVSGEGDNKDESRNLTGHYHGADFSLTSEACCYSLLTPIEVDIASPASNTFLGRAIP